MAVDRRNQSGMVQLLLSLVLSAALVMAYVTSHLQTVQYVQRFASVRFRREAGQVNLGSLEILRAIIRAEVFDFSASTATNPSPTVTTAGNGKTWYATGAGADLRINICSPVGGGDGFTAVQSASPCTTFHYLSQIRFDKVFIGTDGKQYAEVTVDTGQTSKAPIHASAGPAAPANAELQVTTRARVEVSGAAPKTCTAVVFYNYHHGCGPWAIHNFQVYIPGVKNIPLACGAGTCGRSGRSLPESVQRVSATYGARNWNPPGCTGNTTPYPSTLVVDGTTYHIPSPATGKKSPDCDYIEGGFSPLVVDFKGEGIRLVKQSKWPSFDISNEGPSAVAWPSNGEAIQFLAFDKDGSGTIDGIDELFGNATRGSDGLGAANGFLALRKEAGSWALTRANPLFSKLLLWSDRNANGISEPGELRSLAAARILSLDLRYKDAPERLDAHGSLVIQKGAVKLEDGSFLPLLDFWPAK